MSGRNSRRSKLGTSWTDRTRFSLINRKPENKYHIGIKIAIYINIRNLLSTLSTCATAEEVRKVQKTSINKGFCAYLHTEKRSGQVDSKRGVSVKKIKNSEGKINEGEIYRTTTHKSREGEERTGFETLFAKLHRRPG